MDLKKTLMLVALLIIIITGVALSIHTILGPNILLDDTDDFFHLLSVYNVTQYGFGVAHLPPTAFSTTYLWVGIPALFASVFGMNLFTESILSILSLVGATAVIFLTGRALKSDAVGLLAALTFVLMPIVAAQGASPGNNMPATFSVSLAVLLFLFGTKTDEGKYYAASGFVGFAGTLASSAESLFAFVFLIPAAFFMLYMKNSKRRRVNTLLLFAGIVLAMLATVFLGLALRSSPFEYFSNNLANGNYPSSTQPEIVPVLTSLFPTNSTFMHDSASFSLNIYSLLDDEGVPIVFGFFGYAMLISACYLLVKRRSYAIFPIAWFLALFLWLIFGKVNTTLSGYIAFHLRFMTILAPPIAVIVGLALGDVAGLEAGLATARSKSNRAALAAAFLAAAFIAFTLLAVNSLMIMHLLNVANYLKTYQQAQTASFLKTLPSGSFIYTAAGFFGNLNNSISQTNTFGEKTLNGFLSTIGRINAIVIDAYTGFNPVVNSSIVAYNCSNLVAGYMIAIKSEVYANKAADCSGVAPLFSPSLNTTQLGVKHYSLFQNITVYRVS